MEGGKRFFYYIQLQKTLPTVAEIAITLGGFIGLIDSFRPILIFWGLLTLALLPSGLGVLWPFSPGLLLLGMTWSLLVGVITLIALMAKRMNIDGVAIGKGS